VSPKKARDVVTREVPDILEEELVDLKNLFPQVVSEGKIDFEELRLTLGSAVQVGPERYSFSWSGKRNSIQILQTPTRATLVPSRPESLDFQSTGNLFIEGDNLEVLKLLYKPYFAMIKMIYIDPPYNTGGDFVYPDDYVDPLSAYLRFSGQVDSEGNLQTSNPETSGRFHSTWLSMMYPRLFLARQLLTDDGVIFVSIDDTEFHNLRLIMNDIFGEENFVGTLVWRSKHGGGRGNSLIIPQTEYILVFAKNISLIEPFRKELSEHKLEAFSYEDSIGKYGREGLDHHSPKGAYERKTLQYDFEVNGESVYNPTGQWLWSRSRVSKELEDVIGEVNGTKTYRNIDFVRDREGRLRAYKKVRLEGENGMREETLLSFIDRPDLTTNASAADIKMLFGAPVFDYSKPAGLIKYLINATFDDGIVLDFFAGSGTTAHAVLEQNAEDGKDRKFILVQLPELTPEGSEARKAGYKTIADICAERIRRVVKLLEDKGKQKKLEGTRTQDLGFRFFKLTQSNYRPWKGVAERTHKVYSEELRQHLDPLIAGWQKENVLYEILLKEGYPLTSPIVRDKDQTSNEVWRVSNSEGGSDLFICLDAKIQPSTIRNLRIPKDHLFVCRDIALSDSLVANLALQCRLRTV